MHNFIIYLSNIYLKCSKSFIKFAKSKIYNNFEMFYEKKYFCV